MNDFWQRLKQRKLVQWAITWVAFAFALLQGIDIIAQRPSAILRPNAHSNALALDPHNRSAKSDLSSAVPFSSGDIPRALTAVQGDDPQLKRVRAGLLTYQRKYRQALALLDNIPDTPDNFQSGSGGGPKAMQLAELYRQMGDVAHARRLYTQALPQIQAQLRQRQDINQAFVWQNLAAAEFGLGHSAQGLAAIIKAQTIAESSHDHIYHPLLAYFNAALYAEAQRPDLAAPLLGKVLASRHRRRLRPRAAVARPGVGPDPPRPGFSGAAAKIRQVQTCSNSR